MPQIETLLNDYDARHRHPLNRAIHAICIPIVAWAAVALLWAIPFPWRIGSGIVPLNWAVVGVLLVQTYYFRLSRRLGSGLMLFNLGLLWLTAIVETLSPVPLWQPALTAFLLAWAGQFLGHLAEGRQASLREDLRAPLAGPAWLMSLLTGRLGLPI